MPYCPVCGTEVAAGDAFCQGCGESLDGVSSTARDAAEDHHQSATPSTADDDWEDPAASTSSRDTQYYIGAIVAAACVIFFPYFLFLVAIPESILAFWGKSIQDSLGRDARHNPFVSGSFLIIRWFGNFLLLVIVLGIVGIFLLVALG